MGNIPIHYHCRFFLSLFSILLWSNHFIDLVGAATTTIDDAASPAFTFISTWNAITPSDPCNGCSAELQSNLTFDGTWHDGSVAGYTGSLLFDGQFEYLTMPTLETILTIGFRYRCNPLRYHKCRPNLRSNICS